jgi:hypothetical protein
VKFHSPANEGDARASVRDVTRGRASGARRRYAYPVAVWVFERTLTPGEAFFVDRDVELGRDRVDIVHVQVDESGGASVTLVLREIEPSLPPGHGDEPRKTWLELMVPFLSEAEALIPRNSPTCGLDIQHGHDLFVHTSEVNRESTRAAGLDERCQTPIGVKAKLYRECDVCSRRRCRLCRCRLADAGVEV